MLKKILKSTQKEETSPTEKPDKASFLSSISGKTKDMFKATSSSIANGAGEAFDKDSLMDSAAEYVQNLAKKGLEDNTPKSETN
ncbi:MAG: hypothetical protein Q4G08_11450 [Capnocytophaga sp.]|nr:hypothetical protein [Capnocytophaga sp.]